MPADCVNTKVENYHWGDVTSGLFEGKGNGFETTPLLDHNDNVTEGPSFNVFAVFKDPVSTRIMGACTGSHDAPDSKCVPRLG
ncbi:hypothetical protein [uncultured Tateyamaria sp.]|nr:hypothetical protein [uncultured Tateyamaria sp.]